MSWRIKARYCIFYLLPLIAYLALIFSISSIPSDAIPGPKLFSIDKVYHIIEYFILSLLVLRLMIYHKVKHAYLIAILIAALYGVTDEFHQGFVPGRLFSYYDMVANAVGASLVLIFKKLK